MGLGAAGVFRRPSPGPVAAQNPFQRMDGPALDLSDGCRGRAFSAAAGDTLIPRRRFFPPRRRRAWWDFIDLQLAGPYGRGAHLYLKGPFPPKAGPSRAGRMAYTARRSSFAGPSR